MKELKYEVEPKEKPSISAAAVFCVIIGIITVIYGIYVSYKNGESVSQYSDRGVSIFLKSFMIFFLIGCFLLCMAGLFQNVKTISDLLKGFNVRGDNATSQVGSIYKKQENSNTGNDVFNNVEIPTANSKMKSKVQSLIERGIVWIDESEAGNLGKDMIEAGLFVKKTIDAPLTMSEMEARNAGFMNWRSESGKQVYCKSVIYVPGISKEEYDSILQET